MECRDAGILTPLNMAESSSYMEQAKAMHRAAGAQATAGHDRVRGDRTTALRVEKRPATGRSMLAVRLPRVSQVVASDQSMHEAEKPQQ